MAVRQQDVVGSTSWRSPPPSGSGEERVDQQRRVAVGQLEEAWPRKRMSIQFSLFVGCLASSRASSDSNRHADEHAQPGLLGHERAHRGLPGLGIGLAATRPICSSCALPNHPPSARASLSTRCSWGPGGRRCRARRRAAPGRQVPGRPRRSPRRCRGRRAPRHHTSVTVKLTELSHGAGCGCKLGAADLERVLAALDGHGRSGHARGAGDGRRRRRLPGPRRARAGPDGRLLHPDRRRPVRLRARSRPPTPSRTSMRWAGEPLTALNLVAFSLEELGDEVLREILRGGADVVREAGGGHRRRPLDRRPRAQVRARGDGHGASRRGALQRRRRCRRRAGADQAARRRRDRHRGQARNAGHRGGRGRRGGDDGRSTATPRRPRAARAPTR